MAKQMPYMAFFKNNELKPGSVINEAISNKKYILDDTLRRKENVIMVQCHSLESNLYYLVVAVWSKSAKHYRSYQKFDMHNKDECRKALQKYCKACGTGGSY